MDNVEIIDDFFSLEDCVKIFDNIINNENLSILIYRQNSNNQIDVPFSILELSDNNYFNQYLKSIIEKRFEKSFELIRVYSVMQAYEQTSNYHYDDKRDNAYTFCYYINRNLNHEDGGFFYIKIPNEKYIVGIEPISNRGIFFPSPYIHRGKGYNRFNSELRICVTWKLLEII